MKNEFKNATIFVEQIAHEFINAHLICQKLSKRLSYEKKIVKFKLKMFDWVKKQIIEMNDKIENFETQLKIFKLK